jgi:hypothetical protein
LYSTTISSSLETYFDEEYEIFIFFIFAQFLGSEPKLPYLSAQKITL